MRPLILLSIALDLCRLEALGLLPSDDGLRHRAVSMQARSFAAFEYVLTL